MLLQVCLHLPAVPMKLNLGADQVVAAILVLGDESFKLDLIQLFTLNS